MEQEKRFLVDVGMKNLPFPIKAFSRNNPEGQPTIANISIIARIMHEFEANWIDKFIQIVHMHRQNIGTNSLKKNIKNYIEELNASTVRIDFEYPYFVEKITPISKEKCLVRYHCTYSVKASAVLSPKIIFKVEIPVITSYPESSFILTKRLFGQLSIVTVEVQPQKDVYPEDLIEIVDRNALVPMYSFLTPEDQDYLINEIHKKSKTSVLMVDDIKEELSRDSNLEWYSVTCNNLAMLHSYCTVIGTEKSMWVPSFSDYSKELDAEMGLS